jgi:hypothetical protein
MELLSIDQPSINHVVIKFTDDDFRVHTYNFIGNHLVGIRKSDAVLAPTPYDDDESYGIFVLFYKNKVGVMSHIFFTTKSNPIDELSCVFLCDREVEYFRDMAIQLRSNLSSLCTYKTNMIR